MNGFPMVHTLGYRCVTTCSGVDGDPVGLVTSPPITWLPKTRYAATTLVNRGENRFSSRYFRATGRYTSLHPVARHKKTGIAPPHGCFGPRQAKSTQATAKSRMSSSQKNHSQKNNSQIFKEQISHP
jgi:hypothetical protein